LRGLTIRLAADAGEEERFTARELSAALAKAAGATLPVARGGASKAAIVLRRNGPAAPLPVPGETAGPESREAYSIRVTPKGVDLEGKSSAAVYYAAQTLLQLVEGAGAQALVPEVEIHDWPSLPYRGVMIDMSHGPMPTEAEVKRQIDFLARWKNNQYYLYSEASIGLDGFPLQSSDAEFSKDEIRRIVAYARERHVDVVPCMELYGHLHDLFRVERFADLSILPHGTEFNPRNPKVAALMKSWVDQLTDLFPSKFFHIGFDETGEAPVVAAAEKSALYQEQFQLVSGLVRGKGRTLLVWSDMFSRYPELIPRIPEGTVVVPWGYDRKVYEPYWKPFENSQLPRFIATGVSVWDQVAPAFSLSFDNIDSFLAAGRPHGVTGLINTVWTDDMMVLLRPAFPGMAYGAIAAWQADPVDRKAFFPEYSRIMYGEAASAEVAPALVALDGAEDALAHALNPRSDQTSPALFEDPLTKAHLARAEKQRDGFRKTRLLAEDAQEHFTRALRLGGDAAMLSDFLLQARLLDYAGMKNIYAAEMAGFGLPAGRRTAASGHLQPGVLITGTSPMAASQSRAPSRGRSGAADVRSRRLRCPARRRRNRR
jgi:hypothetical protein